MPGGYIPRLEIMERECWKFLDWRLNSDNDSRLHGQPSSSLHPLTVVLAHYLVSRYDVALGNDGTVKDYVFLSIANVLEIETFLSDFAIVGTRR